MFMTRRGNRKKRNEEESQTGLVIRENRAPILPRKRKTRGQFTGCEHLKEGRGTSALSNWADRRTFLKPHREYEFQG